MKPGADIVIDDDIKTSFAFELARTKNTYAYNVPRDLFDKSILQCALDSGAALFFHRAELIADLTNNTVRLTPESLDATDDYFKGDIDLIIDASGRQRLIARKLNLPYQAGSRKDLALFAHLEHVDLLSEGNIHVDRLEKGWGWRIPLPDRVSVGIVVSPKHLDALGNSREEQYDEFLRTDGWMKKRIKNAKRLSPVMTYSNYQMKTERLYGPGWALVGDSAGFIDPVFSTGLYLAMDSAFRLDKALENQSSSGLKFYESSWHRELENWQSIIDAWYDGRLISLFKMGQETHRNVVRRWINKHVTKHITRIFTGEIAGSSYSHKLLHFMIKYVVREDQQQELRIR